MPVPTPPVPPAFSSSSFVTGVGVTSAAPLTLPALGPVSCVPAVVGSGVGAVEPRPAVGVVDSGGGGGVEDDGSATGVVGSATVDVLPTVVDGVVSEDGVGTVPATPPAVG